MTSDRYSRQAGIVPEDRVSKEQEGCLVIGVGAIGRQVALQLTAIGVRHLQLVDHDTVEETNVVTQGYPESAIGFRKVVTTAADCVRLNGNVELDLVANRFRGNQQTWYPNVFVCVDTMAARSTIWRHMKPPKSSFYADGRMAAESLRVLATTTSDPYYESTLHSDDEAYEGSCTARSTVYCANIAAGVMVSNFTRYLRDIPLDQDLYANLLTMEWLDYAQHQDAVAADRRAAAR